MPAIAQVQLGDIAVDVIRKDIKNVHLSVHPPTGKVRIAAPARMGLDVIRVFAISKLGWIRQQQRMVQDQDRESPREYLDRESHYVWGKRYLLKVIESEAGPLVELTAGRMHLRVRPGWDQARRHSELDAWYREQVRSDLPALLAKWEPLMGVKVGRVFVQRMKTKWGSCNPATASLRLNTDLAKKPRVCLEYIAVHEMTHLLEPTHNSRFVALMDQFLPNWKERQQTLNRLPLRHDTWVY
jgi:predicted metal-dependent hydrolase